MNFVGEKVRVPQFWTPLNRGVNVEFRCSGYHGATEQASHFYLQHTSLTTSALLIYFRTTVMFQQSRHGFQVWKGPRTYRGLKRRYYPPFFASGLCSFIHLALKRS